MRKGRNSFLWTEPCEGGHIGHRHLSYVLYEADREGAPILTARCPEVDRFAPGRYLTEALELDEEGRVFLSDAYAKPRMLVVRSNVGVGILDQRYLRDAGVGIYWHLHGDPEVVALWIQNGVFGSPGEGRFGISGAVAAIKGRIKTWDVSLYKHLADVWRLVSRDPGSRIVCDGDGGVYVAELAHLLEQVAAFAGCRVMCDGAAVGECRARCRHPALLEVVLLCLMTEVTRYARGGVGIYTLGALGGMEGEGLSLVLRYPLAGVDAQAELDLLHSYLNLAGELGGLELRGELDASSCGEWEGLGVTEMAVTLEWLRDPAVLSTTDLKAKPRWRVE